MSCKSVLDRFRLGRPVFPYRLTLLGRSLLLISTEVLANLVLWVVAAILFGPEKKKRKVLSLCVIAWAFGLRHGLDADHISAIDNATRHLLSLDQMPTTVGLFFSLGHSTIVLAVTIAIVVSTSVIDHIDGVSTVGGIVGTSVSASFLLVLAIINTIMLSLSIRRRRKLKLKRQSEDGAFAAAGENDNDSKHPVDTNHLSTGLGCITRLAKPIFRLIDRPWKMYPVGVLFGFGFDTASEIALLGVSSLTKSSDGNDQTRPVSASNIIILPLLFTAGMSLVDSLDAIGMVWGYGLPKIQEQRSRLAASRGSGNKSTIWKLWERRGQGDSDNGVTASNRSDTPSDSQKGERQENVAQPFDNSIPPGANKPMDASDDSKVHTELDTQTVVAASIDQKQAAFFKISVVLTLLSITVAVLISIVEFMGMAAELCHECAHAAEEDSGLQGKWWRFWNAVNDNSGYVGAGVVGLFLFILLSWLGVVKLLSMRKTNKAT